MKPRIIGVKTCRFCQRLVKSYKKQGVDFEYWDGDRDDLQDELDKMKINDFPVVQIIDDNKNVIYTYDYGIYSRGVSCRIVKAKMKQLEKTK